MEAIGSYRRDYWHVGDTMADGNPAQVVRWTQSMVIPGGPIGPPSSPQTTLYRMSGDVVYARSLFPQVDLTWDTLYYLGVPGSRWWPRMATQQGAPFGMLEIQDTGSVVIEGIPLRTWRLAYLDENGAPIPLYPGEDSLIITERMGAPSILAPRNYDNLEWVFSRRLHYHDPEISVPAGGACGLPLGARERDEGAPLRIHPNPASHALAVELRLALKDAMLAVRDAHGRLIMARRVNGGLSTIGLHDLSEGVYSIELLDSGCRLSVQRLVVQR